MSAGIFLQDYTEGYIGGYIVIYRIKYRVFIYCMWCPQWSFYRTVLLDIYLILGSIDQCDLFVGEILCNCQVGVNIRQVIEPELYIKLNLSVNTYIKGIVRLTYLANRFPSPNSIHTDANKSVIFNYSDTILTEPQEKVLKRGLNFSPTQ